MLETHTMVKQPRYNSNNTRFQSEDNVYIVRQAHTMVRQPNPKEKDQQQEMETVTHFLSRSRRRTARAPAACNESDTELHVTTVLVVSKTWQS